MKKVGIITFHRAMNCGAMLQAYALQEVLNKKFSVSILDYRCKNIEYLYNYKRKLSGYVRFAARYILKHSIVVQEINRARLFIQFSNDYLHKSKREPMEWRCRGRKKTWPGPLAKKQQLKKLPGP